MLESNLSSPPKLGGVPNGGGGLTRREDKDKNQQSDRPLRPLGGTSPNLGEELSYLWRQNKPMKTNKMRNEPAHY